MRILYDANAKVFWCSRCKILMEADSTEYFTPTVEIGGIKVENIPMCKCPKCGYAAMPVHEVERDTGNLRNPFKK